MHAKHVVYIRTLLRTLKARIKNTDPLIKNLSRLLRKNLGHFMWVSIVYIFPIALVQHEKAAIFPIALMKFTTASA